MASSRKPASKAEPAAAPQRATRAIDPAASAEDRRLLALLTRNIAAARRSAAAARTAPPGDPAPLAVAVAYSGGRDSTVLLELAARWRDRTRPGSVRLVAIHVHHGLQAQAESWAAHCAAECAARHVEFVLCRVRVAGRGRGVEDAARQARYAALAEVAARAGLDLVLTAHHRDDRIETFLLQWLRGAGPAGLAGPAAARPLRAPQPSAAAEGRAPEQESAMAAGAWLARPLLDVDRAVLERFAARHALRHVDDPSNAAPIYARNVLRAAVLPRFAELRPGFRAAAARSIDLVAEMAQLAAEVAQADLADCMHGNDGAGELRADRLLALSAARRAAVVRAWLAHAGIEAPTRARLGEALRQLLGDATAGRGRPATRSYVLGGRALRRAGDRLWIAPPVPGAAPRAGSGTGRRGKAAAAPI